MRPVLTIAGIELRRFLRDRSNIFFVFLFPLLLVLLLGSQYGGGGVDGRAALAGQEGPLRTALVAALERNGLAVTLEDADTVRDQLARGRADVGVILPAGATRSFTSGRDVSLDLIEGNQQGAQAASQRVRTAVASVATGRGQLAALGDAGVEPDRARGELARATTLRSAPTLKVMDTNRIDQELDEAGRFDVGAAGETLLFVFLISLTGSATLISARRLGILARTLSAPVSAAQAISGQALGRLVIACFQGGYIMVASALLFDVRWGSIWLSLLVLLSFGAVAAGAAMVVGSVLDNARAANGLGIGLGLVLAALGGCMLPLELFPDTLRTVAHVTPHAWAYDAFAAIQRHDAGLVDVLPELGVLTAMAVALLAIGTWTLRRSLTRAL